jgi:hypothetical protein
MFFNKKTLPFFFKSEQASLLRKKLCVVFIFTCMLINGFAFSTVEIGKHSLFMITIAATQNIISSVIAKYNDSLAEVSSKVCAYIENLLFEDEPGGAAAANKADEAGDKSGEKGKTDVSAALNQPYKKEIKRSMPDNRDKSVSEPILSDNLFKKYANYKITAERTRARLLLFLIFIAAIRHRKGICDAIAAPLGKIIGKVRISA